MPEGPEIKRAADSLARAIALQPALEVFFAFDHLKPYEPELTGRTVKAVQPQGKAMLIRFDNQLNIYSHNQLYGKWMVRNAYAYPNTNRQLRLAIHTAKKSALLYSASDIEVLRDDEITAHPFLSQLGPDVLDQAVTLERVVEQFYSKRFHRRRLTGLLLDQHFLCGLGNYLRSEVLYVAGVHPSLRPVDCSAEQIHRLADAALTISRQSYVTGGITNDLNRAADLKAQGYARSAYRHHAFSRDSKPCFTCGSLIRKKMSGGRRYYYCPTCQPQP